MHTSNAVIEWKGTKKNINTQTIDEFFEDGITSIYQLPNVLINKLLKDAIKSQYEKHQNEIAHMFVLVAKIQISCFILTHYILNVYEQLNNENMRHGYI
jgi:hypothetical protein